MATYHPHVIWYLKSEPKIFLVQPVHINIITSYVTVKCLFQICCQNDMQAVF